MISERVGYQATIQTDKQIESSDLGDSVRERTPPKQTNKPLTLTIKDMEQKYLLLDDHNNIRCHSKHFKEYKTAFDQR